MKKALIATTALLLTGGAAMADVTISGNGRFGLLYQETDFQNDNETTISYRLRFNIDASKETDSGVTFGGRIRMQYDNGGSLFSNNFIEGSTLIFPTGSQGASLNAAQVNATYQGMTLQVGNVDTAYDSAALMYNSEIGFLDRSSGDPQGSYFSYASKPYGEFANNRMGVFFGYSVAEFNVRFSWVNIDQTNTLQETASGILDSGVDPNNCVGGVCAPLSDAQVAVLTNVNQFTKDEYGISADYTFGQFTVSGAYVNNGSGINGNNNWYLGGEYALSDQGAVGLQYFDNGDITPSDDTTGDLGTQFTLYGNYRFNDIIAKAYIATNDADAYTDDIAGGIGLDYDLGGATLSGSIQSDYFGNATGDIGVRFSF